MDTPPRPSPEPSTTPSRRPIGIGFAVGTVIWLLPLAADQMVRSRRDYFPIELLIFACFILPPVSGVLAAIRKTRRFGLGLLLACGVGWLVLGAICGGVFR